MNNDPLSAIRHPLSPFTWEDAGQRLVLSAAAGGRILSWITDGRERVKPAAGLDGGLLRVLALPERYPGSSYATPHETVSATRDEQGFELVLRYAWNTPGLVASLLGWPGKRNPAYLDGLWLEKTVRFTAADRTLAVTLRFGNAGTRTLRISPWFHNGFEGWVERAFVSVDGTAEPYRWDNLFWSGHRAEGGRDMRLVCADAAGRSFAVLGASADWLDGMAVYTKADFGDSSTEGSMELRGKPVELAPGSAWEASAFLALTDGPDSWTRWARTSPLPLAGGPTAPAPAPDLAGLARRILPAWALPEERDAGLMILSPLDKVPFTEQDRTTANRVFGPFRKTGTTLRASVQLAALANLDGLEAALEAPAGWSLGRCPKRLKKGALAELVLSAPADGVRWPPVRVTLSAPGRRWTLSVPPDATVERRHPVQVRQLSDYLEARFRRERDVFTGDTADGFRRWATEKRRAVRTWLRQAVTRPVRPEGRLVERQEGPYCVRDKILIRTEPDVWMPCFRIRPKNAIPGRRGPAILFCCGSGPGKAAMAPDETDAAQDPATWEQWPSPYTLAHQLGATVLIPDRRGWGEWGEANHNQRPQRALAAGYSVVALEVWDHLRAVDWLAAQPDVDAGRITCMGSSGGGHMTLWLTGLHDRLAGGIISSAMTLRASTRPDFFHAPQPDPPPAPSPGWGIPLCNAGLASLAAPKPLWIMDGLLDGVGNPHVPEAEKHRIRLQFKAIQDDGRAAIRRAYDLLDAGDRCRASWFEDGHLAGFHFTHIRQWLSDFQLS